MSDGRCYLIGEQFTTADILLTACLTWAVDYGVPISESATGFLRRIAARSGYIAATKANFVEDFDGAVYFVTYAYVASQTMAKVLEQCGNNLTRSSVMQQAASLKDFKPDMILPGVTLNTSASDFAPMEEMRTVRLQGERWQIFGDVMSSSSTGN